MSSRVAPPQFGFVPPETFPATREFAWAIYFETVIQGAIATAVVPISIVQPPGNLPVSFVGPDGEPRSNIASLEVKQR